jgi:nanoRNase/pAp phosphatase (c-di-AMP/oligoRNAs hydrolase)
MPIQSKHEIEKLLDLVKGKKSVLILTHENPDPDSIASAFGLKYIFRKAAGISSVTIGYTGIIGRTENKNMVNLLGIDMVPYEKISPRKFSVIVMVDCQPYAGNVTLPKGVKPTIIIDHHPLRKTSMDAEYIDVRKDFGSVSTIIAQYIRQLELLIDRKVATALFYGIKSDTRDMGREATDADVRSSIFLFPYTLQKKLAKIEHPRLPVEYFREMYSVLKNSFVYGDAIVARVESIKWPEMIGEFADELVQMEGIQWCFCYGRYNGSILFSVRTTRSRHMAGVLAHKIVLGIGTGGGHETFAGGKIDVAQALKKVKDPEEIILKRFLKEICPNETEPRPLISSKEEISEVPPNGSNGNKNK